MGLTLVSRNNPLASSQEQLHRLALTTACAPFETTMAQAGLAPLHATGITVLQINVGKLCNQTCRHCHVDAGPERREQMTRATAELCMNALAQSAIPTVDITGGAPELNANFRWLVEQARALGRQVMDRCNLTVLFEPGMEYLPEFFKLNEVELVCSLPCYSEENVDKQRGKGTFDASIRALQLLNEIGYGQIDGDLVLNLVYNPVGAFLPPSQKELEVDYKRELEKQFGIMFNKLYALSNLPIGRFASYLRRSGRLEEYMQLLIHAFNPATISGLMCRNTINVGWRGEVYDCDFNQQLGMQWNNGKPIFLWDINPDSLENREIMTGDHCFGCTAGAGSSCGGAIV